MLVEDTWSGESQKKSEMKNRMEWADKGVKAITNTVGTSKDWKKTDVMRRMEDGKEPDVPSRCKRKFVICNEFHWTRLIDGEP